MTPPVKTLPDTAGKYPDIQHFRDQAQVRLDQIAQSQGKSTPILELSDIKLADAKTGDGNYSLVYENRELNIGLEGKVLLNNHSLSLWNYTLKQPNLRKPFGGNQWYREMTEACSVTKAIVGADELPHKDCQDGVVEPKLAAAAQKYSTLKIFDEFIKKSHREYLAEHPELPQTGEASLKRTRILNPTKGSYRFDLLYDNPGIGFYCRGSASTRDADSHHFLMACGSKGEYAEDPMVQYTAEAPFTKQPVVHQADDACDLTRDLVGPEEFHGKCENFTSGERAGVSGLGHLWTGIEWALLGTLAYDAASVATRGVDFFFKTSYHAASFGKWGSPTAWVLKKAGSALRWPVANAPRLLPYLRSVPGALNSARFAFAGVGTMGTGGGSTAGLGTVGTTLGTSLTGAMTTVSAWGATSVGAASAGSIGLAAAAGFAGGFAIGTGIEKAQQWAFGTSISSMAGDLACETFGPADQSTIDWCDKYLAWLP